MLSFVFYHGVRGVLGGVQRIAMLLLARHGAQWRPLSEEMLAKPLALAVVMTSGPRWNPHALIATAGPFRVARSICVERAAADRSAEVWTVVAHQFPNFRTAAAVGAGSDGTLELPPGRYTLALRYYQWNADPELPPIRLDGKPVVPAKKVSADVNRFYRGLSRRGGRFYFLLHYYVFEMLLRREHLRAEFVRREFAPAGNPETDFLFGAVRRGEHVDLAEAARLTPTHLVYFTLYNRASFPVEWYRVTREMLRTEAAKQDGFYLIRSQKRPERKP